MKSGRGEVIPSDFGFFHWDFFSAKKIVNTKLNPDWYLMSLECNWMRRQLRRSLYAFTASVYFHESNTYKNPETEQQNHSLFEMIFIANLGNICFLGKICFLFKNVALVFYCCHLLLLLWMSKRPFITSDVCKKAINIRFRFEKWTGILVKPNLES